MFQTKEESLESLGKGKRRQCVCVYSSVVARFMVYVGRCVFRERVACGRNTSMCRLGIYSLFKQSHHMICIDFAICMLVSR